MATSQHAPPHTSPHPANRSTNDDEIAAKAICYAGCYELLYKQHVIAPPAEVI